jgi:predicted DNA-binding transcriptional regulator YafY
MNLIDSVERLKKMDALIKRRDTGTSKEFAQKIGISRSMLMHNLCEMKALGAEISFCSYRRSYCYDNDFSIVIGKSEHQRQQ